VVEKVVGGTHNNGSYPEIISSVQKVVFHQVLYPLG